MKGDITTKHDLDAIHQQMRIICILGEFDLPFEMGLGLNLRTIIFEKWSVFIQDVMQQTIETRLKELVSRTTIMRVVCIYSSPTKAVQISITHKPDFSNEVFTYDIEVRRSR